MNRSRFFKTMWIDMFKFPKLGIGAYRVWFRDFYYFKKFIITALFFNFMEPLLYIVAFGYGLGFFVGKIDGIPYLLFFAPAILASTAMQGAVFEATYSSFTKLKVQKTFETIIMTPITIEDVVAGEIAWSASKSFFGTMGVMFVLVVLGLVQTPSAWLTIPVVFLIAWAMSAISMVVCSFARDYDSFTYYFSLFITPMSLLAGTFFPLSQFPVWAQKVALFLPLTHGVIVCRALFLGRWNNEMWLNVGILFLIAVVFSNWAINQTKRRLIY